MTIQSDFESRFPEFDQADIDTYLPGLVEIWPCYYGGDYEDCGKEIVLNLLAHLLVSETSQGSGNLKSVQSKTAGSLSVSYSESGMEPGQRNAFFRTTKYGTRYLMLTANRSGAFFV